MSNENQNSNIEGYCVTLNQRDREYILNHLLIEDGPNGEDRFYIPENVMMKIYDLVEKGSKNG